MSLILEGYFPAISLFAALNMLANLVHFET